MANITSGQDVGAPSRTWSGRTVPPRAVAVFPLNSDTPGASPDPGHLSELVALACGAADPGSPRARRGQGQDRRRRDRARAATAGPVARRLADNDRATNVAAAQHV